MKKLILFTALFGLGVTVNAQLLVTDSSFNSFDNGVTFSLIAVDSSYHAAGNCRLAYAYSKVFNIATQQLTNATYRTNDYFNDGNLRQTVIQVWNPGLMTYGNSNRTTFTYYQTSSKVLTSLGETWVNNSTWRNSSLQTNTYDANGYLTVSVFQNWDVASSAWVKEQQIDYYNKNNGLADSSISKDYENNVITHQTKDIYTYNGSSLFRIVNQIRAGNQWQDSSRSTFTYNPGGKVTIIDNESYSPQTPTWTLFAKQTFAYNAAGDLITLTQNIYVQGFALITQTRYRPVPCTTSTVTPGELCPAGNGSLSAGLTGASYQWQVNTGSGFANVANNSNYAGATTATLTLSNIPSSWYGYQYRCVVAGQNSTVYTIKFINTWTGATNSQWEVGSNWSCGTVPDANTDAVINTGGIVILNSNRSVRSLTVNSGARFTANTGFKLTITH